MTAALRSLLFNGLFYGWSVLLAILVLPALLLPTPALWTCGRLWTRGMLALLRVLCGLRYRLEGLEHLSQGPCLVASKHQSAWDIFIFLLLLREPAYVLKRELTWIPLFGWYLGRLGMVAVDRAGGAKALRRMVRQARERAAEGRPLVIFPEGTRTPPGSHRPYHPGVAALYQALDLPVVPVALNSGRFWRRRAFTKRPGTIELRVLPPIPPGLGREAFMERLRSEIETACDALLEEPQAAE